MLDPSTNLSIEGGADEAEDNPALSDEELVAALRREYDAADSFNDQLRLRRDISMSYYEGDLLGNEIDGRSQVVLPDVQEAVDYMLPSILRPFVSGDRVVEFEATEEEDEQAVEEATQAVNYSFLRKQDGYRILHDFAWDGLVKKIGVIKSVNQTCRKVVRDKVIITDPVQLEQLGDVEIEGVEETSDGLQVSTSQQKTYNESIDVPIPLEYFRFSPLARHEDEADYIAHCEPKTRSELVEMGFDREQVYSLPVYSYTTTQEESSSRNSPTRPSAWGQAQSTPALEKVLLCEEYALIDRDGDGIAERIRVYRVENEILIDAKTKEPAIEEWDGQPFTVWTPFPRPHQLVGDGLADKVIDIQILRSTIARQLFDGMYNANMPRPIVDTGVAGDPQTIDDLLSPIPGSPIRAKGGAASVQPYQTSFDVGKSLTVIEWISAEKESRTGITRLNQGLEPDVLNNSTAEAFRGLQSQGQQQEEFISRNLGEAFARMQAKKYRLMREAGQPVKIKVDGQYKMVDPSKWPEDVNVVIKVGLGTGSKDKRISYRMSLMQPMAEGFTQGLVSPQNTFKMIDGLVRDMGLGTGDDFWIDPDSPEAQQAAANKPQQPDPAMAELQMKQQQFDQQQQFDRQKAAATLAQQQQQHDAKMELDAQAAAAKIDAQRESHAMELEHKREMAAAELQLTQDKAAAEARIAVYGIDTQAAVDQYGIDKKAETDTHIDKQRPGGALDA
jgi:hypothetical protein